jgi:peptide deformylase
MEGRATFTMVTSMPTMSRLMEQMRRTPTRRRRLSGPGVAAPATGVSKTIIVIIPS